MLTTKGFLLVNFFFLGYIVVRNWGRLADWFWCIFWQQILSGQLKNTYYLSDQKKMCDKGQNKEENFEKNLTKGNRGLTKKASFSLLLQFRNHAEFSHFLLISEREKVSVWTGTKQSFKHESPHLFIICIFQTCFSFLSFKFLSLSFMICFRLVFRPDG